MKQEEEKSVLVPIGEGFEEIETVSVIDILRRAGAQVVVASIMGKHQNNLLIKGSRNIIIQADSYIEDQADSNFDLIALPGGLMNAKLLAESQILIKKLKKQKLENKFYAAICASPAFVFEKHGLFEGEQGTCYDGFHNMLQNQNKILDRVVISNKCITSRGPGTSLEWSFSLVECLYGSQKAIELAKTMIARR